TPRVSTAPAHASAPAPSARAPSRPTPPKRTQPPTPRAESQPNPVSVEVSRSTQAQALYEQALKDQEQGALPSALTNTTLALAFDRTNVVINRLYTALAKELSAITKGQGPTARVASLFDEAVRAERLNEIDLAIKKLEEALAIHHDARCLNRLGVIL